MGGGLTAMVLFGLLIRWLVLSRRQLAQQEEVTEVERARRTILEEKARIARDLHDVVAHHMSMVVVQAQSAPYRIDDVSPETRAEFESIGATGRDALNEIAGCSACCAATASSPRTRPHAGRSADRRAARGQRRAGIPVLLDTSIGDPDARVGVGGAVDVPHPAGIARQRGPARAGGRRFEVSSRTSRPSPPGVDQRTRPAVRSASTRSPSQAGGNGIIGMRERASSVGGSVTTQLRPDGGFECWRGSCGPAPSVDGHVPA